ncbi:Stk1 family PASTA domain-containing Ser/Thr kinase [Streptomyces noursei]|uniref:Stk1 family PASTA domain-containing Ser/Thr kinase n=1 Tax=Streptomyces noursei TaxID=1971 RepID=UPI000433245B|nr:Stk1 family PASTA domain-containing Ser/Thr kinase [Streptomyces noursei]EXU88485.1 serine/threonine protein kinase [Streptomyces noursei PD-1]UWS71873.1 Stk1 family PASTA domain-containing Ser/Thr kinase [Streptomyces noursei]
MDTTLQDPLVGQLLDGRYRVEGRIAAGGMATVYRAVDTRLDRVLALKVMHPSLAVDGAFVDRFIREAKSVARLSHPNVVGVFDQGTDGTYVYLAMEYVAGCTLRDVLRERGALQPRAALDILEPILAALGAAHRAGLVHRDMKPENVLIGDDGRVKVADFGLVRAVDTHTTASTGSVLGTVSYLAPEQMEHGTADARVDVYACGVVLYEMLTGSKPHTGGSAAQILYSHLHDDVTPPSELVPGLAPELDELVAAATARAPEQRPQDAVALLARARSARARLTDAQLDVVPPQAREAAASDDERTDVIPRPAGVQLALPVEAGAELNRTSRLEVPPADAAPDGRTTRLRPPPAPHAAPAGGRLRHRRIATIVAAVLLVLGVGGGLWYINVGQFTHVPAVLDMTQAEAQKSVQDAGLRIKVERGFSANVRRGHVMATKPGTGQRIRGNGTVTLVVSRGPDKVAVPDLAGTPLADARRKLRDLGLVPGTETRTFSDEVAKGSVIRTDPAAGSTRRPDTAVALTVSRGAPVDVPNVVGSAREDAAASLRQAGFRVQFADQPVFSPQDKDAVARQSPGAGTTLGKGDTVTLTLSKGPEMVTVPDVGGKDTADATKALTALGFKVEVDKPFLFPQDSVASQSVAAGDQAPKGSTITIRLKGAL